MVRLRIGTLFEHGTTPRVHASSACKRNAKCSSRTPNGAQPARPECARNASRGTATRISHGDAVGVYSGMPCRLFQPLRAATKASGNVCAIPAVLRDVAYVATCSRHATSSPSTNGLAAPASAVNVHLQLRKLTRTVGRRPTLLGHAHSSRNLERNFASVL